MRLTDANFDEEVLHSKIPVLVDFWASWCIPSQINVDQNPKTRNRYNINGCPTVIVFNRGKEVIRKIGAQSDDQLRMLLDSIDG